MKLEIQGSPKYNEDGMYKLLLEVPAIGLLRGRK
jgi:hypothetical protein